MLRLEVMEGPIWIELAPGVEVQVAPLSSVIVARAQAEAVEAEHGEHRQALVAAMVDRVAQAAILDWRGVGDAEGEPLAVSPAAVSALMAVSAIAATFFERYLARAFRVIEEKKGFAPLPTGISAGAPETTAPPAA